MGQYHRPVNLDKKEFLDPYKLGAGLKLWEQLASHPSTQGALVVLLSCSNGRGGGDLEPNHVIGRWAGDRIAYVGDYAERADLPASDEADLIWGLCEAGEYLDVTELVIPVLERELAVRFVGEGWRRVIDAKPTDKTSDSGNPQLSTLRDMLERALALTKDPHLGTSSWRGAINKQMEDIVAFMLSTEDSHGS